MFLKLQPGEHRQLDERRRGVLGVRVDFLGGGGFRILATCKHFPFVLGCVKEPLLFLRNAAIVLFLANNPS